MECKVVETNLENQNLIHRARAEIFRVTRVLEKITQHEMAKMLRLGSNTYSNIEKGKREVSINNVGAYSLVFGVEISDFLKAEKEVAELLANNMKTRYVGYVVCKLLLTSKNQ